MDNICHVFIAGSKSMGAYGGYETFVDKLTEHHQDNSRIKYHVACKANGDGSKNESKLSNVKIINDNEFIYHNAHCFKIQVPQIGAAQAVYYDLAALEYCCKYIKKNNLNKAIIYILACRIGPFMGYYKRRIHHMGGKIYVNPDGHEWMREKWNALIRRYWKFSERLMVKHSDLLICDSKNIEKYIHKEYDKKYRPKTVYIAYGAENCECGEVENQKKLLEWYNKKGVNPKDYYLVVGRFVPENNYETMIREFMKSHTKRKFVLITNVSKDFLYKLKERTSFDSDRRIKFVGTVYDSGLLALIRRNAYGYFHGHEVGGTNPSLLEALANTDLNLLLDVGFNREVAGDAALYWKKRDGSLAGLIDTADKMSGEARSEFGKKAKKRIADAYSWEFICNEYKRIFSQNIK